MVSRGVFTIQPSRSISLSARGAPFFEQGPHVQVLLHCKRSAWISYDQLLRKSQGTEKHIETNWPYNPMHVSVCHMVYKPLTNWDSHANVSNVSQISLHWQILWRTQRHKDKEAAPNPEIQQPRKVARVTREEFNPTQPWKSNKSNEMPRTKSLMSQLKRYQVVKK
jgi:hypothetical protein